MSKIVAVALRLLIDGWVGSFLTCAAQHAACCLLCLVWSASAQPAPVLKHDPQPGLPGSASQAGSAG